MRRPLAFALVLSACSSSAVVETTAATETTLTTVTTTSVVTTTTIPVYQISGRVVSADGAPVSRATVAMGEMSALTAPDGWFSFETTTPTDLSVSKPGWTGAEVEVDDTEVFYEAVISKERIRGLRVGGDAAGDDEEFQRLIDLANQSAVNALVFDTKQEGGEVLYDTGVSEARDIGAVRALYDPAARLHQAGAAGLYTITRIVTFEDRIRASSFPDEKLAGPWLEPTSETARAYNLALAAEACEIGFDEVMFDYVRYPAGKTAKVSGQLDLTEETRVAAVSGFLAEARRMLNPMGCAVSAAIFAIVVSSPDDQGLGQRPEEISAQTDVLSPMVYPSHYSNGWLGFGDPNDYPYEVTADALGDAQLRMAPGAELRPWLQAFWWTNAQIRTSIQAAEDLDTGWILWNARSNFDLEALPTVDEVGS